MQTRALLLNEMTVKAYKNPPPPKMLIMALLPHTVPKKRERGYVVKLWGYANYGGILQLKLLGKSVPKVVQYIHVIQKECRNIV